MESAATSDTNGTAEATSSRKRPLDPDSLPDTDNSQLKKKTGTVSIAKKSSRELVMNNDLVVAKIGEKLPARLLWDLRSFCPRWNQVFIPQLKEKQAKIKFNGKSRSMIELLQVIQTSRDNPFTNYSFELDADDNGIHQRDLVCFPNFISVIGNTITKLELNWKRATELSVPDLRRIIFELTPQLAFLTLYSGDKDLLDVNMRAGQDQSNSASHSMSVLPKLIEVHVVVEEADSWLNGAFTQLISDVIRSATNLEILYLDDCTFNWDFIQPTIAGLLQSATTRSHIHKLKTLELDSSVSYLPNANLRTLIDLAAGKDTVLKLESVSISVLCWKLGNLAEIIENFRLLYSFLVTQSPTLNVLELDFRSYKKMAPLASCRLPRMERLKKLILTYCDLGEREIQFGETSDSTFADIFPNLKTFICSYKPGHGRLSTLPEVAVRFQHPGVTDLELRIPSVGAGDFTGFSALKTVFPSLARLSLGEFTKRVDVQANEVEIYLIERIDMSELSKVWTTWPALTVLYLRWRVDELDMDLDVFLSGITRKRLERLKYDHTSLFPGDNAPEGTPDPNLDSLRTMLVTYNKTRAAISDLRHLQEFAVRFEDNRKGNNSSDYPQLTDMGGYCGIGQASNTLQKVTIQASGKNVVSKSCLAFIRSKFGVAAEINL